MRLDHDHFIGVALELSRHAAAEGNRPLGSLIVDSPTPAFLTRAGTPKPVVAKMNRDIVAICSRPEMARADQEVERGGS